MEEKCKYKSSGIIMFVFGSFLPFITIVIFGVGDHQLVCLIIFILWLLSLSWFNNVEIYDDRIVTSRFFCSHVYVLNDVKSCCQTYCLAPRFCFINFKKGVTWRKFIVFMPVLKYSDIFLTKKEPLIEFLNKKK